MHNDELYMHEALVQARCAFDKAEVPIGAVVVDSTGVVVAGGHNTVESVGCQAAHAEVNAVRAACKVRGDWRLDGCTLYVTVQPCFMCLGLVVLSRCHRLVYGLPSERFGYTLSHEEVYRLHPRCLSHVTGGVLTHEIMQLMRSFFQEQRNGAVSW